MRDQEEIPTLDDKLERRYTAHIPVDDDRAPSVEIEGELTEEFRS